MFSYKLCTVWEFDSPRFRPLHLSRGGRAVRVVLLGCDRPRHPGAGVGAAPPTRVSDSHCSESADDILCMHFSHLYSNCP